MCEKFLGAILQHLHLFHVQQTKERLVDGRKVFPNPLPFPHTNSLPKSSLRFCDVVNMAMHASCKSKFGPPPHVPSNFVQRVKQSISPPAAFNVLTRPGDSHHLIMLGQLCVLMDAAQRWWLALTGTKWGSGPNAYRCS